MAVRKWAEVIKAWAYGKEIHFRTTRLAADGSNGWSAWRVLLPDHGPWRNDLNIEYRVKPEKEESHHWQKEKEAYLAGKTVEFRQRAPTDYPSKWMELDSWVVDDCVKRQSPPTPIWDRDYLEFRIQQEMKTFYGRVLPEVAVWRWTLTRSGQDNLAITFLGDDIKEIAVINQRGEKQAILAC